jgi:hypothetical protein
MHLPAWAIAVALLLLAGYAIPYLFLSGVEAWTGAFLFWLLFGAATWLILVRAVSRWNVDAERSPRREPDR